ncbi:MFS transporter [Ruania halotolerans]|uniref:MFS transporter n=1 Tax=Ruania halotolerans TaxID=2897773 RepID=UPI001E511720|nr:MFS transporter [Ruania halotolerans]UFU07143.1 MFS transporter [Ruania halotolerans]
MTSAPPPWAAKDRTLTWPVIAWSLWDWGSAAFNAVITTFVFTVYITSDPFGPEAERTLSWVLAGAGVLIALLAPVIGQRADRAGRRTLWLAVNTALVIAASAALYFVQPSTEYLWLGLVLLAAGNIAFEFAGVNYNAMLADVSTPRNVGRVSGIGWGMGYLGGIVLLLVLYLGLIQPEVGLFGITGENGLDVRVSMLICAGWTLAFSIPLLRTVRDGPRPTQRGAHAGLIQSYRLLWGTIRGLWRADHNTIYFLLSSAVFRDGLAGVFTFGGIIAAGTFGFSAGDVIIFGVVANVVAGIATILAGRLDDAIGPKRVIMGALVAMVVMGLLIFFLHDGGRPVFWTCGLVLAAFVGPAQTASRTFLARLIPAGREGEVFGLYATTGRAVSFLAPAMFGVAISIGIASTSATTSDEAQYWGILGIVVVLLVGLVLLIRVKPHDHSGRSGLDAPSTEQAGDENAPLSDESGRPSP